MKIVTNTKLIKRNSRIARYSMLAGLIVLGAGMFVSFRFPEQYTLSLLALMAGFILSQVGIFFSNRWGRSPRPDELLTQSLKGLDSKYTLYHYSTPASHVLLGPAGLWVLLPRPQRGEISYSKGRFRQKGGNLYLKIFAQEGIGRPDLEISGEVDSLKSYLDKRLPEGREAPPIQAAMVLTNPKATVNLPEGEELPAELVHAGKLKDMVRKKAKEKPLSLERIGEIQAALGGDEYTQDESKE